MTETINCPECEGTVMGVVIPGVMDGVLFWTCMDCGTPFHRWPEGHSLRERAEPFIRDIERHRAVGTPDVDTVLEAWGRTS